MRAWKARGWGCASPSKLPRAMAARSPWAKALHSRGCRPAWCWAGWWSADDAVRGLQIGQQPHQIDTYGGFALGHARPDLVGVVVAQDFKLQTIVLLLGLEHVLRAVQRELGVAFVGNDVFPFSLAISQLPRCADLAFGMPSGLAF